MNGRVDVELLATHGFQVGNHLLDVGLALERALLDAMDGDVFVDVVVLGAPRCLWHVDTHAVLLPVHLDVAATWTNNARVIRYRHVYSHLKCSHCTSSAYIHVAMSYSERLQGVFLHTFSQLLDGGVDIFTRARHVDLIGARIGMRDLAGNVIQFSLWTSYLQVDVECLLELADLGAALADETAVHVEWHVHSLRDGDERLHSL